MSIESTVISAVGSEVASAAGSTVLGAVETVAGAAVGNPISYLKIAGYAVAAAAACYLVYRVVSFVETAAEDHAAKVTLTAQVGALKAINVADRAAFQAKLAERDIVVAKTNKLADDLAAAKATVEAQREELRHAPSTANYRATPDDQRFLDGLRKPTR